MIVVTTVIGGSLGAVTRYVLTGVIQRRAGSSFPLGTAVVNLAGAFLLGSILRVGDGGMWWTAAAGFTGGLTTFSTWMVETVNLGIVPRPTLRAVTNMIVPTASGVALAALGYHLAG